MVVTGEGGVCHAPSHTHQHTHSSPLLRPLPYPSPPASICTYHYLSACSVDVSSSTVTSLLMCLYHHLLILLFSIYPLE